MLNLLKAFKENVNYFLPTGSDGLKPAVMCHNLFGNAFVGNLINLLQLKILLISQR